MLFYTGIDIGSTASKVAIFENENLINSFVMPTGWNSRDTAKDILNQLGAAGINSTNSLIVATGYGRVSVPYANKTVTEITCHGKGADYLLNEDCTVIDIGGQDTKIITVLNGKVTNFTMNDKCAAGTGRFLELMANTLGLTINEMCELSELGREISISSMCTVFAESEVISLIGSGKSREDISYGVLESITGKVKSLCQKHSDSFNYFLTGGLSDNKYIIDRLSQKLGKPVKGNSMGRFAGAIGAAIIAKGL
jgi:predicted CoA-substrate-specific enzyme activase